MENRTKQKTGGRLEDKAEENSKNVEQKNRGIGSSGGKKDKESIHEI